MAVEKDTGNDNAMNGQSELQHYEPRQALPPAYVKYTGREPEEEVHLRNYLKIIMKRKRIVLAFFISVVITVAILTLMMTPIYKSVAVIRIDKDGPDPIAGTGTKGERDVGYYATQYEILKSKTLSEKVVKKLDLHKNARFMPVESNFSKMVAAVQYPVTSFISYLSAVLAAGGPAGETPLNEATYAENEIPFHVISSLISRLDVVPVKNSQLVEVSFMSHRPELSMIVANAVAETYIEYDLESRIAATQQSRAFLVKQIEITKKKLEDAERKLNEYASKNQIIFFDGDKQGVSIKKLADITTALSASTTERMQKEALLKELQESGTENPIVLGNPLIQELKRHQATLESEYSNLSKIFTPDYPKMQNLQRQMDAIAQKIEREKSIILKSLESDYKASLKKERSFRRVFQADQRNVLDFQGKAAEYMTLKREADVNKELHNGLLQKLNEAGVAAMSKSTSIQIVDHARYPTSPYKPNKSRNILLAVVFGLIGGVGLAFSVEYFDNTIKDVSDIESMPNIPALGMIPLQKLKVQGNPSRLMIANSKELNAFTEAFRSIGVLLLSSTEIPPKTILVTSASEKEGKTTISVSTAVALSQSVGKGIIIDADLRRPRLHNIFELDNAAGLSTFLTGKSSDVLNSGLIKPTKVKGLSIMTSGPIPHNPSELLLSPRIKDLIKTLGTEFNYIILDSVPLMGMPESIYLSKIVDGTILVVRGGKTPKDALLESVKLINSIDARLLGVVLNGARENDLRYGSYSYYSSYFDKE